MFDDQIDDFVGIVYFNRDGKRVDLLLVEEVEDGVFLCVCGAELF